MEPDPAYSRALSVWSTATFTVAGSLAVAAYAAIYHLPNAVKVDPEFAMRARGRSASQAATTIYST